MISTSFEIHQFLNKGKSATVIVNMFHFCDGFKKLRASTQSNNFEAYEFLEGANQQPLSWICCMFAMISTSFETHEFLKGANQQPFFEYIVFCRSFYATAAAGLGS